MKVQNIQKQTGKPWVKEETTETNLVRMLHIHGVKQNASHRDWLPSTGYNEQQANFKDSDEQRTGSGGISRSFSHFLDWIMGEMIYGIPQKEGEIIREW